MLKFLDNRIHEVPRKSPKKYKPQMLYGISIEAPQQFQHPYTIVKKDSYINPYLKFQQSRRKSISPQNKKQIQPKWRNKININMLQQQKIVSSVPQLANMGKIASRYATNYYHQLENNTKRFHLTRGQFTNFIQKNNHYKPMGPMQGIQRSDERIRNTLKTVWIKSTKAKQGSTFLNSSLNNSMKRSSSSFTNNNSKLITQKTRIRFHRQNFNSLHKTKLQQRKKKNLHLFQLPKIGSEIVSIYNKNSINLLGRDGQKQDQQATQMQFLDTFSQNLARKFK